jgi:hypothetical protein
MEALTSLLENRIRLLEEKHGFLRTAVREGSYRVRYDRKFMLRKIDPEVAIDMGAYALSVTLFDRFAMTEKEIADRIFIQKMLDASSDLHRNPKDPLIIIQECQTGIMLERHKQDKVGEEVDATNINYNCMMIAASALRIRDINKGITQERDGTLSLIKSA